MFCDICASAEAKPPSPPDIAPARPSASVSVKKSRHASSFASASETPLDIQNADTEVDINLILSEYQSLKKSTSNPDYRDFIKSFIDRIDVGKYRVNITLKTGMDIFPELDTEYEVRRQEIYER